MENPKRYKYTLPIGYMLKGGENDYVIEEVLGKGGFGVTYKVKATVLVKKISFDLHFAVKEYFPDICSREADNATIKIPETKHDEIVDGIKDFLNEGRKLQNVCDLNPNIVNVNEIFEANGTAYYVLEFLEGGDLRKMVKNNGKPLTEQQMLDVMTPIGSAVQCLHDNHILHLDIKPDNIVMRRKSDGTEEPVLIDFGIAVHFGNDGMPTSKTPSQGISPGYSPIEQYSPVKKFEPRIDVYSFAATCLYLLTGKNPMEAFDMTPVTLRNEIPQTVSPHIAQALAHAMSKDKHDRTNSVDEMIREMVKSGETIQIVPEKPSTKPENATVNLAEKAAAVSNVKEEKPKVEKIPSAEQKTDAKPAKSDSTKSVEKPPQPSIGLKKKEDKRKKGIAMTRNCLIIAVICAALIAGVVALERKCSHSNQEKVTTENEVSKSSAPVSEEIELSDSITDDSSDYPDVTIKQPETLTKNETSDKNTNKKNNVAQQKKIDEQLAIAEIIIANIMNTDESNLLPSNTGLDDIVLESKIRDYNDNCLKYQKIISTASGENPVVLDLKNTLISQRVSILSSLKSFVKKLEAQKQDK